MVDTARSLPGASASGARRRILFARTVDQDNINAQSRNTKEILARWRSETWRPSVFAFGVADEHVVENPRVDVIRLKPDRSWRLRLARIYQGHFDAIFYPGLHHRADYLALHARAWTGRRIPVITTFEGLSGSTVTDENESLFSATAGHPVFCHKIAPGQLRRHEWINEHADHIIAISPFLQRMARARYGDKTSYLPLGVDTLLFRRGLSRDRSRLRVVTAGNLRPHKRPELFVKLAERFPEADFCWFGEGDLRRQLIAKTRQAAIENIAFPGAVGPERLGEEFANSDIFVLPSKSEGVPKVTQEAAAAGLAQIVFGFYETPSVVDGENGFVVWDDRAFEARLADLIADSALIERMGRASASLASGWSWESIAPLWEERILACAERAQSERSESAAAQSRIRAETRRREGAETVPAKAEFGGK